MGQAPAAQAASFCCHVERLPRQQLSVAAAPASGPQPGVQMPEVYGAIYEELFTGYELDKTTWVHNTGIRSLDVRNVHTGLVYCCLRLRKSEAPLEDPDAIEEHIKALCGISHPHLCKVVECFDLLEERLLICEKPSDKRFFDDAVGKPWSPSDAAQGATSSSQDITAQLRKDERTISEIIRQLIAALAHGHSRGFVHGILTPDKIRVHEGFRKNATTWGPPQIKVIGFGLGHVLLPTPGLYIHKELIFGADTRAFAMLPGLAYTAPETCESSEDYKKRMKEPAVKKQGGGGIEGEVIVSNSPGASPHKSRICLQEEEEEDEDDAEQRNAEKIDVQKDLLLIDSDKKGFAPEGSAKADIWSVGALAFRLLTGVPPFHAEIAMKKNNKQEKQGLLKMLKTEPVLFTKKDWEHRSTKCYDAVRWMLRLHAGLRPSAVDLLRHPWLKLERESVPYPRMHRLFSNALNFLKESQFKKLVIRVISEQMPEHGPHMTQASQVFRSLDKDRDGLLSSAEFMEGLQRAPDLLQRLGEDPGKIFEAADRDGSGYLDFREFAACTMPPAKARDEKIIWYVFRAFDEERDGIVTIDKVLYIARLLEGRLSADDRIDELLTVLQSELKRIRVPMRVVEPPPEKPPDEEEEEESESEEELKAEGEFEGEEEYREESKKSSKASSMMRSDLGRSELSGSKELTGSKDLAGSKDPARQSSKVKKKKKLKVQQPWWQKKAQSLVEKTRKWVTKPRPLDFGEFAYLCDTRRKGMGPRRIFYKAARKEAFRIAAKYEWDFYEVVHKLSDLLWPPEAGEPATNPRSCYFVTGGLCSSRQQQLRQDAKEKKTKKAHKAQDEESASEQADEDYQAAEETEGGSDTEGAGGETEGSD